MCLPRVHSEPDPALWKPLWVIKKSHFSTALNWKKRDTIEINYASNRALRVMAPFFVIRAYRFGPRQACSFFCSFPHLQAMVRSVPLLLFVLHLMFLLSLICSQLRPWRVSVSICFNHQTSKTTPKLLKFKFPLKAGINYKQGSAIQ